MIINDLDDYYIVFDTKNRNIELDTLLFFSIDIIICEIRLKYGYIARYCLPDSSPLRGYSPETSSRVTLASLGIGFQPNLVAILHLTEL